MEKKEKINLLSCVTQLPFIVLSDGGELFISQETFPNPDAWIQGLTGLFADDRDVECLLTKNLMCIGHIHDGEQHIYLGPVSSIKCDINRVKSLLREYHLSKEDIDATFQYFQKTGRLSISRFADITALAYYVITGNSVTPRDLIPNTDDLNTQEPEPALATQEEIHNGREMELRLFSQILFGRPVEKAFDPSQGIAINEGTLSFSPINHRRYMMTSSVAIAARYAVSGGMDYNLAMSIADGYIQLLDRTTDVTKMLQIGNDMFRTYSTMVADIQLNYPQSLLIYKVQKYIISHLNEPLTVQELAKMLGVSRTYLSAHFREVTGTTLNDYICGQKINQAKMLLKTTSLSISDIANSLAYSSQSHFQAVFKKKTGMTPKNYRETLVKPFEL